jgi:hypothetical protein
MLMRLQMPDIYKKKRAGTIESERQNNGQLSFSWADPVDGLLNYTNDINSYKYTHIPATNKRFNKLPLCARGGFARARIQFKIGNLSRRLPFSHKSGGTLTRRRSNQLHSPLD